MPPLKSQPSTVQDVTSIDPPSTIPSSTESNGTTQIVEDYRHLRRVLKGNGIRLLSIFEGSPDWIRELIVMTKKLRPGDEPEDMNKAIPDDWYEELIYMDKKLPTGDEPSLEDMRYALRKFGIQKEPSSPHERNSFLWKLSKEASLKYGYLYFDVELSHVERKGTCGLRDLIYRTFDLSMSKNKNEKADAVNDIWESTNIQFHTHHALQFVDPSPIPVPKPDKIFGYPPDRFPQPSLKPLKEDALINGEGLIFPYFIFIVEGNAHGTNQALGGCACALRAAECLIDEKNAVFSLVVNNSYATFSIMWKNYDEYIQTDFARGFLGDYEGFFECRRIILNIHEWAKGPWFAELSRRLDAKVLQTSPAASHHSSDKRSGQT